MKITLAITLALALSTVVSAQAQSTKRITISVTSVEAPAQVSESPASLSAPLFYHRRDEATISGTSKFYNLKLSCFVEYRMTPGVDASSPLIMTFQSYDYSYDSLTDPVTSSPYAKTGWGNVACWDGVAPGADLTLELNTQGNWIIVSTKDPISGLIYTPAITKENQAGYKITSELKVR